MKKVLFIFYLIQLNLLPVRTAAQPPSAAQLPSAVQGSTGSTPGVHWGEVVFSEVMYDPDPPVKLPAQEYLELLNRSGRPLSLEGWKLGINSRIYTIPGVTLFPGERVVLTAVDHRGDFGDVQHVAEVFGSGYALPNDGAVLALYDAEGKPVHAARYQVPWQGPGWKAEGGWSLESADEDRVCGTSGMWEFSGDPSGGTPGRENSHATKMPDREAPVALYGSSLVEGKLQLTFSEPVLTPVSGAEWIDLKQEGKASLQPGRLEPRSVMLMPGGTRPDSIVAPGPLGDEVHLYFPPGAVPAAAFQVVLSDIVDCAGNPLKEGKFQSGTPAIPEPGSVIINEVMYDPWEGDPEFIELLVTGSRYCDLVDLSVAVDGADPDSPEAGSTGEEPPVPVPLSRGSRIIAPGDHLLVSRNTEHLRDRYHLPLSGRWIGAGKLQAIPNSGATIYLTDRAGNTIDVAVCGDHMHLEILGDTRGVSLERVYPDRPGSDPGNWHSAASIEGYSTPGRPNSQSPGNDDGSPGGEGGKHSELVIEPGIFSPDNDGHRDILEIRVETGTPGYVIRLWVTDPHGVPIRNLANNHLAGPSVTYTWNGEQDDGQMAVEGIYVVHLAAYHHGMGTSLTRRVAVGLLYR